MRRTGPCHLHQDTRSLVLSVCMRSVSPIARIHYYSAANLKPQRSSHGIDLTYMIWYLFDVLLSCVYISLRQEI